MGAGVESETERAWRHPPVPPNPASPMPPHTHSRAGRRPAPPHPASPAHPHPPVKVSNPYTGGAPGPQWAARHWAASVRVVPSNTPNSAHRPSQFRAKEADENTNSIGRIWFKLGVGGGLGKSMG